MYSLKHIGNWTTFLIGTNYVKPVEEESNGKVPSYRDQKTQCFLNNIGIFLWHGEWKKWNIIFWDCRKSQWSRIIPLCITVKEIQSN